MDPHLSIPVVCNPVWLCFLKENRIGDKIFPTVCALLGINITLCASTVLFQRLDPLCKWVSIFVWYFFFLAKFLTLLCEKQNTRLGVQFIWWFSFFHTGISISICIFLQWLTCALLRADSQWALLFKNRPPFGDEVRQAHSDKENLCNTPSAGHVRHT